MAKKHSSKTATEKAWSASEPRLQVFTGWQGVNFAQAPLGWEPNEPLGPHNQRQNDLKPNFLHVQNNVVTADNMTLETRMDSEIIGEAPEGWKFTGVACIYHRWLFCVVRQGIPDETTEEEGDGTFIEKVVYRDINTAVTEESWTSVLLRDDVAGLNPEGYEIGEIGYYEKQLIATVRHKKAPEEGEEEQEDKYIGEIFTSHLEYEKTWKTGPDGIKVQGDSLSVFFSPDDNLVTRYQNELRSAVYIEDPTDACTVTRSENLHSGSVRTEFTYVYTNSFGSTLPPETCATVMTEVGASQWSSLRYVTIKGTLPAGYYNNGVRGVDVYGRGGELQNWTFVGRTDIVQENQEWELVWTGAMADISAWSNVQLEAPKENTTKGVKAFHFTSHDSRLYFWGDPDQPYRLWIGGNPGNELSVARGHGGAYVDIEPGTGLEVMGTAKWKTSSGANIVTIMCGNPNTNMIKRFNLVETNLSITNEISSKGYMYEEVSNVVGCNSRWGYGVFADGLYSINRYGLMLTTMAMEYNNQMRTQSVSDVIKPIFTERLGHRLDDARMVCIDNVIYILLSEEHEHPGEPTVLDQVVLCYDLGLKAWYTMTSDEILPIGDQPGSGELVLHAMSIDSQEHVEGLGLITEETVILYPNTGIQEKVAPQFNVLLETGELMGKQPKQMSLFLCQLELRFDYFIGHATVEIEGIDYYGRPFTVVKELNSRKMSKIHGRKPEDVGEYMRDYTEWIRIDKIVESYRIRIKGKARFRLNNINAKVYIQDDKIGLPYGFDDHNYYANRNKGFNDDNHWIRDYNNLRRTLLT